MLTNNSGSYRTNTQIVVVGGGPAGTTVATMLARKGLSVILLERANFPRDHVGESLLPASMPILKELGVITEVEQSGFLPKYGATMLWGSHPTPGVGISQKLTISIRMLFKFGDPLLTIYYWKIAEKMG